MLQQNVSRKHHYIPVFYSREWAGANGELVRYRQHRFVTEQTVHHSRVGWEEDLYRIPDENGPDAQRLETKFFRELDGHAASALRKLLADPIERLTEYDVGYWSMFMRSLLHRSPSRMRAYKQRGVKMWWEVLCRQDLPYDKMKEPADPFTLEEYLASRTDVEGEANSLLNLPHTLASPTVLQKFAESPWLRIDVPDSGPSLLLSDAPIAMSNGFDTSAGHLAMALSPTRMLIVVNDQIAAEYFSSAPVKALAKALNRSVAARAEHFVASISAGQAKFIRKHFGSAASQHPN